MANQIRLKRASGSDPGASDLVLGEPAVRTDTGEIFLKKDDGSIAKVAGGIDDGDKGDITVSNSGATFTIDNDAVTYAKIQNVSATNRILGRDSSGAGAIEEITPANLRTMLNVADGATNVTNTNQLTNGAGFITATLTNEQVQDIVGGMVSSNTETGITVTYQDGDGTLDFVVASQTDENFTTTLKNKLDGIAASATNVTNNNQLTNGAGYITDLVNDSSPQLGADLDTNSFEILFDDDHAIKFGASNDLQIKHNSSGSSSIANTGSGALTIQNANSEVNMFNTTDTEYLAQFINGGASKLYHDGTRRLETTSYGSSTNGVHSVYNGILELRDTISTSHTLSTDHNAISVAPTIADGITVTVPSGAVWAIV
tara:strand:- start:307 stop:1422 length:1116 start_codon:yes stop_codon:yes gene_type:complete